MFRRYFKNCFNKYNTQKLVRRHKTELSIANNPVDINQIPLNEPIPGMPSVFDAKVIEGLDKTFITTLDNGLRVASERKFGKHCTVGIVADAGSRYEVAFPSGISHFLEKLAYGATRNFESKDVIMTKLENYGGICDCQITRDVSIYAISAENRYLSEVVGIIADAVWQPLFPDSEVDVAREKILFELEDIERNPQKEGQLMEMVHAAAYRNNTLGLPKICSEENVPVINRNLLYTFLNLHFDPTRFVLAAVGVEHQKLVDAAQKFFVDSPPIWKRDASLLRHPEAIVDASISQYTGGQCLKEQDLSDVTLGPTPMPELAHITIGLESCSHQNEDFVATCVLNTLMGGGGSFSAGGPGKGMYSRLYTRVLNRCPWMYNATAYNHSYMDSGVFCVYASAHPKHLNNMCERVVAELSAMAGDVDSEELERAKKQLMSQLLMNLEARPVQFEDLGRQVLAAGHRKRPEYYIDVINKITADDLVRVARKIIRSKPSLAALGTLGNIPSLQTIAGELNLEQNSRRRFISMFR